MPLVNRLQSLMDIAHVLNQQKDLDQVLQIVAQHAAYQLDAEVSLILMVNPRTNGTVKTVYRQQQSSKLRRHKVTQKLLSGWIIKNKVGLLISNLNKDERFSNLRFGQDDVCSALGVAIHSEGRLMGTLLLFSNQENRFTEQGLAYLQDLSVLSAPYLRNVSELRRYFEAPIRADSLRMIYADLGLLGRSPEFMELLHAVDAAAKCDIRVLLEGQSGTGKERIALAIHRMSSRSDRAFIAVDCGAIPENLLESELFGHAKGAFTGATTNRKGLFMEADGGTLFMDEISNLPLHMQAKLMRVLQEGEVRPVGSNQVVRADVRIIAASSMALRTLVEQGAFREDLYFRLHVYPIRVPPLAERQSDCILLANHFLEKAAVANGKQITTFDAELLEYFKARPWPGNVRELQNTVERLVALAPPEIEVIVPELLPPDLKNEFARLLPHIENKHVLPSLTETLAEVEERLIRQALMACDWNQSAAARALKIPVQTIRYKMSKLGISPPVTR